MLLLLPLLLLIPLIVNPCVPGAAADNSRVMQDPFCM
jgi:hypothetical protein